MIKRTNIYSAFFVLCLFISCNSSKNKKNNYGFDESNSETGFSIRFNKLTDYPADPDAIPRSIDKNFSKLKTTSSKTWTSGFFAGNLWYVYLLTNDEKAKKRP